MFDFEEKLVCLYSEVKVYVANHALCQSEHPFCHGQIMSSKVGVTMTAWQLSRSRSCLLCNLYVGIILNVKQILSLFVHCKNQVISNLSTW